METSTQIPILRQMAAVAEPARCRTLRLLARHELTVSELALVLQLPQSTVSRHLKALADEGWVASRRQGTSHFYAMVPAARAPELGRLWALIEAQFDGGQAA